MRSIHRRRFLQLAGVGLIAAPFVNMLRAGRARAASGGAKRLVIFFSPNGVVHSHWRPTGGGADFTFPAGSILEPLAPHQADLIVMDGLNFFQADNHEGGMAAMLTCKGGAASVGAGASIDQYVATELASPTKFRSLEFGVQTVQGASSTEFGVDHCVIRHVIAVGGPRRGLEQRRGVHVGHPQRGQPGQQRDHVVQRVGRRDLDPIRGDQRRAGQRHVCTARSTTTERPSAT